MIGFLEKLERWVHILDEQLNDTTVHTITGKVFTHDPSAKVTVPQEDAVPQDARISLLTTRPTQESHKTDAGVYPPVMKKVRASYK
jgi:hypothetical protein